LKYSQYSIRTVAISVYGREMPLAEPNSSINTSVFTGDNKQYFDWPSPDLKILHKAVRENKIEIKEEDKINMIRGTM